MRLIGQRRSTEQRRYREAAEEAKSEEPPQVVVDEALTDPHPLVAQAERRLRRAKVIEGVVSGRRFGLLDLSVAPDSLDRGLRIFDALLKALPEADFSVSLVPPPKGDDERVEPDERERATEVRYRDEPLYVCLYEEVEVELDPKPYRPRRRPEDPSVLHPARAAALHLHPDRGARPADHEPRRHRRARPLPRDRASPRLRTSSPGSSPSSHLPPRRCGRSMLRKSGEARVWEEQRRRWREEEERRWEEKRRLERLSKEAVSWEEAKRLRAYAEAALGKLDSSRDNGEEAWTRRVELKWLLDYADRVDPLR